MQGVDSSRSFEDLLMWQKAHAFVLQIYSATRVFPSEEVFGLTSQLRRAAVSVPANMAEGFKRRFDIDKARIMNIAESSLEEARYYLRLANDLGYASDQKLTAAALEIGRMLGSYRRSLDAKSKRAR